MATTRENYSYQLEILQREYDRIQKLAERYESKIKELRQQMNDTPEGELDAPIETQNGNKRQRKVNKRQRILK